MPEEALQKLLETSEETRACSSQAVSCVVVFDFIARGCLH